VEDRLPALLLGLALDAWLGDPDWLWRRIGHPVAWWGRGIAALELRGNRGGERRRLWVGTACALLLLAAAAAAGRLLELGFAALPTAWLPEGVVVFVFLAQRGLAQHVAAVAAGLEESLAAGRQAVGRLVGRNTDVLDRAGVARSAIESLAENFCDGVVAPALAYLLFGLPGLLAYKMLNTLDSMWGYRSARFRCFGRAAARLDDVANWAPARLAALSLALAAGRAGGGFRRILAVARRDAPGHRSPNAGWPEAAMAAALGIALAGPRSYGEESVADAWMNRDGRRSADVADIRAAMTLFWRSCLALGVAVALPWVPLLAVAAMS